ncbi:MAG: MBL fold metallo-hydrolase [Robiginitomaculum sp.]|nr:MAG: MBL fold metallo-hydrolase [Robiginitomaculum sp.]
MIDIPFIDKHVFEYGRPERQSRLVTRLTADNPGPFTYTGTGVYMIGTDEVAIIDPGPITKAHTKALDEALDGKTLTHILLTHHHSDHSPMAKPLAQKTGCKIYGLSPKPQDPRPQQNSDLNIKLDAGNDSGFAPDIQIKHGDIFKGGDVFKGNGWHLQAVHTPGHTSNHMCFALSEENTLFSGDHIMGWATSVVIPPDGHMGDYLRSLHLVRDQNYDIIRPTHGPAITKVKAFIQAYIDHRLAREEQIYAAVVAGHHKIMDMVTHIYTDIDKRLYPAAAISVLAHLVHLREAGRVKCTALSDNGKMTLKAHYFAF